MDDRQQGTGRLKSEFVPVALLFLLALVFFLSYFNRFVGFRSGDGEFSGGIGILAHRLPYRDYYTAGPPLTTGVTRSIDDFGIAPVMYLIEGTTGWDRHQTDGMIFTGLQSVQQLQLLIRTFAALNQQQKLANNPALLTDPATAGKFGQPVPNIQSPYGAIGGPAANAPPRCARAAMTSSRSTRAMGRLVGMTTTSSL